MSSKEAAAMLRLATLYILQENPPEELRKKVEAAVKGCPKKAITIEEV